MEPIENFLESVEAVRALLPVDAGSAVFQQFNRLEDPSPCDSCVKFNIFRDSHDKMGLSSVCASSSLLSIEFKPKLETTTLPGAEIVAGRIPNKCCEMPVFEFKCPSCESMRKVELPRGKVFQSLGRPSNVLVLADGTNRLWTLAALVSSASKQRVFVVSAPSADLHHMWKAERDAGKSTLCFHQRAELDFQCPIPIDLFDLSHHPDNVRSLPQQAPLTRQPIRQEATSRAPIESALAAVPPVDATPLLKFCTQWLVEVQSFSDLAWQLQCSEKILNLVRTLVHVRLGYQFATCPDHVMMTLEARRVTSGGDPVKALKYFGCTSAVLHLPKDDTKEIYPQREVEFEDSPASVPGGTSSVPRDTPIMIPCNFSIPLEVHGCREAEGVHPYLLQHNWLYSSEANTWILPIDPHASRAEWLCDAMVLHRAGQQIVLSFVAKQFSDDTPKQHLALLENISATGELSFRIQKVPLQHTSQTAEPVVPCVVDDMKLPPTVIDAAEKVALAFREGKLPAYACVAFEQEVARYLSRSLPCRFLLFTTYSYSMGATEDHFHQCLYLFGVVSARVQRRDPVKDSFERGARSDAASPTPHGLTATPASAERNPPSPELEAQGESGPDHRVTTWIQVHPASSSEVFRDVPLRQKFIDILITVSNAGWEPSAVSELRFDERSLRERPCA